MPAPADPLDVSVTRLLHAASRGEPDALDEVFPLVYGELQRLRTITPSVFQEYFLVSFHNKT